MHRKRNIIAENYSYKKYSYVPRGSNDHDTRNGDLLGPVEQTLQDGEQEGGGFSASRRSASTNVPVTSIHQPR